MAKDIIEWAGGNREPATTDEYFGGCPFCSKCEGTPNLGRDHWHYCETRRVKWFVGSNLFSGWRDEDLETWLQNRRILEEFNQVEPSTMPTAV